MIQLQLNHLQTITNHAQNTYPEESCGLLLGKITPDSKIVTEVWQTENDWTEQNNLFLGNKASHIESKKNRFSISPLVMLNHQKKARKLNLAIVGIYHSHPDYPAIPSEFDRCIAWPEYSYVIVSINQGEIGEILSWKLDEQHQFQPEKIIID